MTDAQKKRLDEALRKVETHGDVAPSHVQDPRADLMRWDDSCGCYVLTGTGRRRIRARDDVSGFIIPFKPFKTRNRR
jgi:hypothetical protein